MTTNYCDEIIGSSEFAVFYYEVHNQFFCSVASYPSSFRTNPWDNTQLLQIMDVLKKNPNQPWFLNGLTIRRDDFFSCFYPETIFTKRVKGKQIIRLNGSTKHCANSGSSHLNHGENVRVYEPNKN